MASQGVEQTRNLWVQVPEAQARLIASAALLTALQCRSGGPQAIQPLKVAFSRSLSRHSGQQLCCAHGHGSGAPSLVPTSVAKAPSRPGAPSGNAPDGSSVSNPSSQPGFFGFRIRQGIAQTGAPRSASELACGTSAAGPGSVSRTSGFATVRDEAGGSCSRQNCEGSSGGFVADGISWWRRAWARGPPQQQPTLPTHAPGSSRLGSPPFVPAGARGGLFSTALNLPPARPQLRTLGTLRPSGLAGPAAFRSFAASAVRLTATDCAAGCSRAAAAAAAAAARCTRAGWEASQAHLTGVRQYLLESMAPYWGGLSWGAFLALLYKQSAYNVAWLPYAWSLPGVRQLHYFLLSAINVLANNLPVTLAMTVAELVRSSRTSHADSFRFYLDVPTSEPGEAPWWQALPLQMASLLASLGRTLWLLLLFAPVLLTAPVALQLQFKRAEWIELLRATLEAAGPAFIKWGQWAATRHDLFPPDMCSELEKLHTQAPGHKFRYTKAAIEQAFQRPLEELFDSIDHEPVASGSIGQIHRAVLSERGGAMTGIPAGTTVAVKVRHPGVGAAILRDFATMMAVAHVASLLPSLRHLRLEQTLSQFAAPLREQVDLSREAANLARFNHNFRKTRHVFFPVPLYPLVTPDVLVETFETGEHITAYIQSENNPYNHRLSELGSGTMLQMMLVDNLIHSDLHPGNILVRLDPPGGLLGLIYKALDRVRELPNVAPANRARIELLQQRWLQPSLVLLDVGMATELSPVDQVNMVGLFRSFAAMDGRACGDWTLRFSGESQSCPDPEAFRTAMQAAFDELHKMDLAAAGEDICTFKNGADALASVLELVRQHQVSLPGHICAVVVTTLVLEGWSNKLDPDHSVLTQVQNMFEPENVPWAHRITQLVDRVMEEESNHFALA